jgi:hypothetical protein
MWSMWRNLVKGGVLSRVMNSGGSKAFLRKIRLIGDPRQNGLNLGPELIPPTPWPPFAQGHRKSDLLVSEGSS